MISLVGSHSTVTDPRLNTARPPRSDASTAVIRPVNGPSRTIDSQNARLIGQVIELAADLGDTMSCQAEEICRGPTDAPVYRVREPGGEMGLRGEATKQVVF